MNKLEPENICFDPADFGDEGPVMGVDGNI